MAMILKTFTFQSSSSSKTYETILYVDHTTSCGCPGWCKRTGDDGSRTCKHTRMVEQGIADREAISTWNNPERVDVNIPSGVYSQPNAQAVSNQKKLLRIKKQLDKKRMTPVRQRAINWR